MSNSPDHEATARQPSSLLNMPFPQQPALQLIYDTAPIGLAFLSPNCRYLQINQRLTEICGISVEDHLGRSVRECVPALAESVENIVRSIMETGEPVTGVEVVGQRADQVGERTWITYWHPLRDPNGEIVGVNVAAEEISERKRAERRSGPVSGNSICWRIPFRSSSGWPKLTAKSFGLIVIGTNIRASLPEKS